MLNLLKKALFIFVILIFIFFQYLLGQSNHVDRRFRSSLKSINKINLTESGLYKPFLFTVDDKGNIAIFDYAKYALAYISNRNNYDDITYFSKGLGGGPREFRNPTDIKFGPKGKIWIADPHQARISIWSSNGKLFDTFNHDKILPTAVAVNKEIYFIKAQRYSS